MLDVRVKAESELYFNKSYQESEIEGSNSFKIQTSYFLLTEKPKIEKLDYNI